MTDRIEAAVGELEELRRELEHRQPEIAGRLGGVVERMRIGQASEPLGYISTGEAARLVGVSPNTVKKWVRTGAIRDFWTLPGSGYLKVARSEIDRIRAEGSTSTADREKA